MQNFDDAQQSLCSEHLQPASANAFLLTTQEELRRLRAREACTKAILSAVTAQPAAADLSPKKLTEHERSTQPPSTAAEAAAAPAREVRATVFQIPGSKQTASTSDGRSAAKHSPTRVIEQARSFERKASGSPPRRTVSPASRREATPDARRHSNAAAAGSSPHTVSSFQLPEPAGLQQHIGSPAHPGSPTKVSPAKGQPVVSNKDSTAAAGRTARVEVATMKLREPEEELLGQPGIADLGRLSMPSARITLDVREPEEEVLGHAGRATPSPLPRPSAHWQTSPSRAAAEQQHRGVERTGPAVKAEHPANLESNVKTAPRRVTGDEDLRAKGSSVGAKGQGSTRMERSNSTGLKSPGRKAEPPLSGRREGPALTFASLIPSHSPLHARIAAQQVVLLHMPPALDPGHGTVCRE